MLFQTPIQIKIKTPYESEDNETYCLDFGSDHVYTYNCNRHYAYSARLVKSSN